MPRASSKTRVLVRAEARHEVSEIAEWYRAENPQAAAGFRATFREALVVLAEAPLRWAKIESDVRRYLLPRYPYKLLYSVEDGHVVVLSILHHARHPDTWRRGP